MDTLNPRKLFSWDESVARLFFRVLTCSFLLYSLPAVVRHFLLQSGVFDLGLFTQWSFLITQGNFWEPSSLSDFIKPPLGDHFSLLLVPLSIAFALFPSSYFLVLFQALGLSLAVSVASIDYFRGIPLRKSEGSVVILFFILNPIIVNNALNDFHPEVAFSFLAVLSLFWLRRRKYLISFLSAAAFIVSKEAMVVFGLGLCIYSFLYRSKGFAMSILLFSVVYFVVGNHYVSAYLDYANARYGDLGNSFMDVALSPILKPHAFALKLLSLDSIVYLSLLLLPFIFLFSAQSFPALLASAPAIIANLLSASDVMRLLIYQYQLPVMVFIIYGVIDARFSASFSNWLAKAKDSLVLVAAIGFLSLSVNLQIGEILTRYPRYFPLAWDVFQASIDYASPDLTIWAHPVIASHFSQRRYVFFAESRLIDSSGIDVAIFPRHQPSRPPRTFLVKLRNMLLGYGEVDEFTDYDVLSSKASQLGLECISRGSLDICS